MIKVKHLMDAVEPDDGQRLWVEPVNLTHDLREWCQVDHLLCNIAPPTALCRWLEENPEGFDFFRGQYHEILQQGPFRDALKQLARTSLKGQFTLLHQSEDRDHNSATALRDFVVELEAWCEPGN